MAEKSPEIDWRKGRAVSLLAEDSFAAQLMDAEFFAVAPAGSSGTGKIKAYVSSAWVEKPVKVWNGTSWVAKPLKRWNGAAWELA